MGRHAKGHKIMSKLTRDMQAGYVRPWAHNLVAFVLLGLPYAVTLIVVVIMATVVGIDTHEPVGLVVGGVIMVAVFVFSSRVAFRIGRKIYPTTRYRKR